MKSFNMLTTLLLVIGGLNWGLYGLFQLDLVASLFGYYSPLARVVYGLVGLSAVCQLYQFVCGCTSSNDECNSSNGCCSK